ncbi:hypothetical protein [Paenibacillus ginsengarvi]|uniref:ABC transporter substrate-binding protein n=1 Tax=Paenibacillus ginsengarvi TaxID=400777 RepID=A0A3B0C7R0_9BACL|nr:hypothetical protein [Paenibacillus ginsengarvi]RKN79026.1 hypothetical protein D7M11_21895 [Paenibacillus ginsengarvi]
MSGHAGKTKVVLLVLAAALAGCSGETGKTADTGGKDTDGGNPAKAPSAPETVTIFPNVPVTDADFQLLFVDPVKKRYPILRSSRSKAI